MKEARKQIMVLVLIFLVCLAPEVGAVAIGASPSTVNLQIQRGGSDKKTFQVSTNSQSGLPFWLEESDSIRGLVRVEPADGIVNVRQAARINISASAPVGATPGNYTGFVIVTAAPGSAGNPSSPVSTGVAVRVNVEIVGKLAKAAGDGAGEPANAQSRNSGIGDGITGDIAAAGGIAGSRLLSATPLMVGAGLVTAIIVIVLILNTMGITILPSRREEGKL